MVTSGKKVMQWQRLMFSTGSIHFPQTVVTSVEHSTHAVQFDCILLSKGHYQCFGGYGYLCVYGRRNYLADRTFSNFRMWQSWYSTVRNHKSHTLAVFLSTLTAFSVLLRRRSVLSWQFYMLSCFRGFKLVPLFSPPNMVVPSTEIRSYDTLSVSRKLNFSWGLCSSGILHGVGCGWLPTFREILSVPSSEVLGCLSIEDGAESLSRNFGNRSSSHSRNTPVQLRPQLFSLCFVERAFLYNLFQMKPNRCTLILSIFISTSLHVSSNYLPIIRRTYRIYATQVFF